MVMNLNYYNRRGKDLQELIDTIKRLTKLLMMPRMWTRLWGSREISVRHIMLHSTLFSMILIWGQEPSSLQRMK